MNSGLKLQQCLSAVQRIVPVVLPQQISVHHLSSVRQASRSIEHWVDAEVGPLWTREVLLYMASLLHEHSSSMQIFLSSLNDNDNDMQRMPSELSTHCITLDGEVKGNNTSSLGLLAAALVKERHWLPRLIKCFGPMLEGCPSSGSGGSSEVRAASLSSVMQSVLDLCMSCCRVGLMIEDGNGSRDRGQRLRQGDLLMPPRASTLLR